MSTFDRREWKLDELARDAEAALGDEFAVEIADAEGGVRVRVGREEVLVIPHRTPIPPEVLEGPVNDAWYWPEAAGVLADHTGHLIHIAKPSAASSVERSFLLTRVVATLGDVYGYTGVYWDPATMVHSADAFRQSAKEMSPRQLPLRLWINFRLVDEEEEKRSLFTTGLEALGEKEIEIWGASAERKVLVGWAYNTAHYLLTERPEIKEGETVAISRTEWVRVFVRRSMFEARGDVYTLVLEE